SGILFLGKSESTGPAKSFFKVLDSSAKIFQRNDRPADPSISFSSLQLERGENQLKTAWSKGKDAKEDLTSLIKSFAPDSIVLDEDLCIQEIYGNAIYYLEFPEGKLHHAIDKLINPLFRSKI